MLGLELKTGVGRSQEHLADLDPVLVVVTGEERFEFIPSTVGGNESRNNSC